MFVKVCFPFFFNNQDTFIDMNDKDTFNSAVDTLAKSVNFFPKDVLLGFL